MEIVHMDTIFHGTIAELIGGTVNLAAFDAAPGQPQGKAPMIVVPSQPVIPRARLG